MQIIFKRWQTATCDKNMDLEIMENGDYIHQSRHFHQRKYLVLSYVESSEKKRQGTSLPIDGPGCAIFEMA